MLTHFWRDSEINQMPQSGQIAKYTIPFGYVNAIQMARANRKLLSDYIRLKSTKDYLQALGNDMGIPISSLIIGIEGYGKEQGTWVHPEIAIDLARWVSVSFRIWANRTLMTVMLASEIEVVQEQTPQNLAPSHEAAQLACYWVSSHSLEKSLTALFKIFLKSHLPFTPDAITISVKPMRIGW
ncbi:KilA-N domain-containing protein [Nostoc sp.]|uniref:KilA-N domain-containing protein n=1 Tax=Nostoc sp. TaxID=1180 RepID=UPI002FF6EC37